MKSSFSLSVMLVGALLFLTIGSARPQPSEAWAGPAVHFGLARSVPAEKSTVHALPEVRLWFTEAPAEGSVSIRLMGPGDAQVATSDPVRDPEDGKAYTLRLKAAAAPGAYRVAWRGMGSDGHVVRGEFGFNVMAH